jgi:hypothetical protein
LDKKAVRKAPGDIENLFSISHFFREEKKDGNWQVKRI